jgi:hypothetical protein
MTTTRLPLLPLLAGVLLLTSCDDDSQVVPQVVDVSVVVRGAGTGAGAVASTTVELVIDCDLAAGVATGTCGNGYSDPGAEGEFTLVATPAAGSFFVSWATSCETSNAIGACATTPSGSTLVVEYDNVDRAGTVTVDVTANFGGG